MCLLAAITPHSISTFGDVVIRVNANYAPAMHIDTDESNAAGLGGTVDGEIIA